MMARLNTARLSARARHMAMATFTWVTGSGKRLAVHTGSRHAHRVRRNLAPARLLSFPHLLVLFWIIIILWGERWVFDSKVDDCDWDHWENWVRLPTQLSCVTSYTDKVSSRKVQLLTTSSSSPTPKSSIPIHTRADLGL
jgi:hypothetical protein